MSSPPHAARQGKGSGSTPTAARSNVDTVRADAVRRRRLQHATQWGIAEDGPQVVRANIADMRLKHTHADARRDVPNRIDGQEVPLAVVFGDRDGDDRVLHIAVAVEADQSALKLGDGMANGLHLPDERATDLPIGGNALLDGRDALELRGHRDGDLELVANADGILTLVADGLLLPAQHPFAHAGQFGTIDGVKIHGGEPGGKQCAHRIKEKGFVKILIAASGHEKQASQQRKDGGLHEGSAPG